MKSTKPTLALTTLVFTLLVMVISFFANAATPAMAQDSGLIESNNPLVFRIGTWQEYQADAASGASYTFSAGNPDDALMLQFSGTQLTVVYVAHSALATLAIEIDGTVMRTVVTTAEETAFGQMAVIDYLSNDPHYVRVYGVGGAIAVDAFIIGESVPQAGQSAEGLGQNELLYGVLNMAYGDGMSSNGAMSSADQLMVSVTDSSGQSHQLENVAYDTALSLDGKWIEVVSKGRRENGLDVTMVRTSPESMGQSVESVATLTGAQPWITVLCKFPDMAGEPHNPTWYQGLYSSTYPGLDHYWRQISYGNITLTGSATVSRWYTLPQNYASYFKNGSISLTSLAQDCSKVADAEVNFPNYVGINMAFNASLGCCAWGGSATLNLDGKTKSYRVTWLPPNAQTFDLIAHEMGHGFNFPHSSGPADKIPTNLSVYVSKWDVMSAASGTCAARSAYGCLATGTNAYNANINKWLADDRIRTIKAGEYGEVGLERAYTSTGNAYLAAYVPIKGNSNQLYVVEVRDPAAGYDQNVPGKAVIIYKVNRLGNGNAGPVLVVDADGNGNVNDAGAMWLPGEVFVDSANRIQIKVLAAAGTGYRISINNAFYPISLAPNGTLTATNDPAYQWKVLNGATWYEVAIIGSQGELLYSQWHTAASVCGPAVCTLNMAAALVKTGAYRWAVRAYGPSLNTTGWSDTLTFNLPASEIEAILPLGPAAETLNQSKPTLTWTSAAAASWYQVRVFQGTSTVYSGWVRGKVACQSGVCSFSLPQSLKTGAFEWTVQGWNPSGMSAAQSSLPFEVLVSAPSEIATPIAPVGSTGLENPTFIWKRVGGASQYRLYITGANGLKVDETVNAICENAVCSFDKRLNLSNGSYQFWVQPLNQFGAGSWSAGLSFSRSTSAMGQSELLTPRGQIQESNPAFAWSHQNQAEWYRVVVTEATGRVIYDQWLQAGSVCVEGQCVLQLSPSFINGAQYRWYVQGWGAAAGLGFWNGPNYFTVNG